MKIKESFLAQTIDGVQYLVPVDTDIFSGVVRGNATAAFIMDQLKKETTSEAIIDAMCARYDAPRDEIAADVNEILDTLRSVGALEE